MKKIAIIGSGPTGIYTATYLSRPAGGLSLTMYEAQSEAGKGTPYHQDWNDEQMLSNIASIELPPINETLLAWMESQPDHTLDRWGLIREELHDRAFFPRVALGEYFKTQLHQLRAEVNRSSGSFTLKTGHVVKDVTMRAQGIRLEISGPDGKTRHEIFDFVVMATGHVWPKQTEIRPGYFLSPWPAASLGTIGDCHVGIRGTSLSGIDAVVALSVARGSFRRRAEGALEYVVEPGSEAFRMTMISRKGLLPEADFYHPIPYLPLETFTQLAMHSLLDDTPKKELLDAVYLLFRAQLIASDPDYAEGIALKDAGLEEFYRRYFQEREAHDTFDWAKRNLREAQRNQQAQITVPWRYAILRMHEVIKDIVPELSADDHKRFNRFLKPVFVDDYATVPHESIERLLALHDAGILDVMSLGEDYTVDTHCPEGGARLISQGTAIHFPAFIEAMGQRALSVHEFPFPGLWEQGIIQNATAEDVSYNWLGKRIKRAVEIGGIDLDSDFHPVSDDPHSEHLYCLSIPFMLSQFPFAQGITSSHEMGRQVAEDILRQINEATQIDETTMAHDCAAQPTQPVSVMG